MLQKSTMLRPCNRHPDFSGTIALPVQRSRLTIRIEVADGYDLPRRIGYRARSKQQSCHEVDSVSSTTLQSGRWSHAAIQDRTYRPH